MFSIKKKIFTIGIICIFILLSLAALPTTGINIRENVDLTNTKIGDGKVEYWALIIGVDYTNMWAYDFIAEEMYNLLLASDHWDEEHIKLLTNENATKINIIKAFNWLDRMDDGDDVCLIYYKAHGGSSKYNYFPFDLRDRGDEYITTWRSENRFITRLINITKNFKLINSWLSWRSHVITDDYFNHMLNKLDSKGVAVILHSCYSGGMIESHWIGNFINTLRKKGRIIMTACEENDTSWNFVFSEYYMMGLQGYADNEPEIGNGDGKISAEEAFFYARKRTKYKFDGRSDSDNPQIDDNFDGELILTERNLPPSNPNWIDAPKIGKTNTTCYFNITSNDPEGHRIRYGYDWHNERFSSYYSEVDEWSRYTNANIHSFSHAWTKPGIYYISIKSQDENGAEKIYRGYDYSCWSDTWTIIITDDEIVDQFHTIVDSTWWIGQDVDLIHWQAQSFIPNASKLSKLKLLLAPHCYEDSINLTIYIRSNLTGNNLLEINKKFELNNPDNKFGWYEFDFEDINLIPGGEYYIILKSDTKDEDHNCIYWVDSCNSERYERGTEYFSEDSGMTWRSCAGNKRDYCFITYA